MVTEPAVKVRRPQFHGCASCREPSPFLSSVPINAIHMLRSKSHGIFFSATIIPHYSLYIAPSSLRTFTLSFGPFPELHCNFVLPSLHGGCLWKLCPLAGLSRWSGPFLRVLPDCSGGLRVYYCAQPHLQKAFNSSASSALSNSEDLGNLFAFDEFLAIF